jgi:hypothetical protein
MVDIVETTIVYVGFLMPMMIFFLVCSKGMYMLATCLFLLEGKMKQRMLILSSNLRISHMCLFTHLTRKEKCIFILTDCDYNILLVCVFITKQSIDFPMNLT